ncbi:UNVERIFIED_CONTAM: Ubiquinol oxidase, mitochondrial [Sesamum angustifolium]|uniref:Ubiquinol oxidase n=1 Tax=Sesamum angustifolium TaxID=2727405 RepID=A0AAW2MU33_9LAMI
MNYLLARSVMKRAIAGGNGGRYVSSCAAAAGIRALTPLDVSAAGGMEARGLSMVLIGWRRMMSTAAEPSSTSAVAEKDDKSKSVATGNEKKGDVVVSSYWGISRSKVTREDGTEWPWNCFMPWETYRADVSIDLTKHHVPKTFIDKVAYRTVKLLRIPTDIFFQRRYGCRAMMLETVAGVPGMVGGMLLHLRSLRKFEQSGGWIKALLEEAENERMHLMTMVELVQPKCGAIENVPAPAIAIDYWRLPKDATLKDVITVIRADEAHHRDVNHFASDIHFQGKELRDAPAPIGYH